MSFRETNQLKGVARWPLILIEGNIGCGKSTFLQHFEARKNVKILKEPIELWEDFNGYNLLQLNYEQRKQYQFYFQTLVHLSRIEQLNTEHQKITLMERSVYSGYEIFAKLYQAEMFDLEFKLLEYMLTLCNTNGTLFHNTKPDLIVYIQTTPEKCYERMMKRNRVSEQTVSLQFLKRVHEAHEKWLNSSNLDVPCPVIIVDGNNDIEGLETLINFVEAKINELNYSLN